MDANNDDKRFQQNVVFGPIFNKNSQLGNG